MSALTDLFRASAFTTAEGCVLRQPMNMKDAGVSFPCPAPRIWLRPWEVATHVPFPVYAALAVPSQAY
ncbi:hypothetical protein J2W46_005392 [Paraburkholderia strydomiana]|nr:hypothetical protein [Paraburkholderia strydomiana]